MNRNLLEITDSIGFGKAFDVSRETIERLEIYADLLKVWQKSKNLVAPKTLDVLWQRHIADSAQVFFLESDRRIWFDFGSGAGFPGLIIAILLADSAYNQQFSEKTGKPEVHLFESNGRKCAFLHEVVRKTAISGSVCVEIHDHRIEKLRESPHSLTPDVVTARALASLEDLLGFAYPIFGKSTRGLFLKGRDVHAEIKAAEKSWRFSYELVSSRTDPEGHIVRIDGVHPV